MSLITCVVVPTGIIISADTRATLPITLRVEHPAGSGQFINVASTITQSDNARKVFPMFNRFGIGCFGAAVMNNLPVEHYIQQLATAVPAPATTDALATMILAAFRTLHPIPATFFIVGGFDNNVSSVYAVDINANTSTRMLLDAGGNPLPGGLFPGGDTQVVLRLTNNGAILPDFTQMYFQDAIGYSRFLVNATIDELRYETLMQTQTVGGNVNSVTITPSGTDFID
jgi:hypothetical protein